MASMWSGTGRCVAIAKRFATVCTNRVAEGFVECFNYDGSPRLHHLARRSKRSTSITLIFRSRATSRPGDRVLFASLDAGGLHGHAPGIPVATWVRGTRTPPGRRCGRRGDHPAQSRWHRSGDDIAAILAASRGCPITRASRAACTTSLVTVVSWSTSRMRVIWGEEAVDEAEVAVGDARHGGDGVAVGEVVGPEARPRRCQWWVRTKRSSSVLSSS